MVHMVHMFPVMIQTTSPVPYSVEFFVADIPERRAYAAFTGTSHFPEKRAEAARAEYANKLAADFAGLARLADTDEKRAQLETEFARYHEGAKRRWLAYLDCRGRCASWFIVGPANYPVDRMRKRMDVADRRFEDFAGFTQRAFKAIAEKLDPTSGPIRAGDPDAVERLTAELAEAREWQERMKDGNAVIRRHRGDKDAQALALRGLGFDAKTIDSVLNPPPPYAQGWETFTLSNSSARIRRMASRLEHLKALKASPVKEKTGPAGIRLQDDPPANRVRLFFPGKPDRDTIASLKRNAFRWTPSLGAWQAYRNHRSAVFACNLSGVHSFSD